MVLEKTLESPLDCKKIKPVNPKGDQSWIFIGRTDAEAEALILWPPDAKNWKRLWKDLGKDSDAGKDWRQEEKGMTEHEMVGWHHWLNGHKFEQTPGDNEGQGSLACCIPWGYKESDTTERVNNSQWLGLWALTAEGPRSIPGGRIKIPQAMQLGQAKQSKIDIVTLGWLDIYGQKNESGSLAHTI